MQENIPTNDELLEFAKNHRPPQSWYDESIDGQMSAAYKDYVGLLKQLAFIESYANALRDKMDYPWKNMTESEKKMARKLSGSLCPKIPPDFSYAQVLNIPMDEIVNKKYDIIKRKMTVKDLMVKLLELNPNNEVTLEEIVQLFNSSN